MPSVNSNKLKFIPFLIFYFDFSEAYFCVNISFACVPIAKVNRAIPYENNNQNIESKENTFWMKETDIVYNTYEYSLSIN